MKVVKSVNTPEEVQKDEASNGENQIDLVAFKKEFLKRGPGLAEATSNFVKEMKSWNDAISPTMSNMDDVKLEEIIFEDEEMKEVAKLLDDSEAELNHLFMGGI